MTLVPAPGAAPGAAARGAAAPGPVAVRTAGPGAAPGPGPGAPPAAAVEESPWNNEHHRDHYSSLDLTTESPSPTVGILAGPKTMVDLQRLEDPIPHDDWNRMISNKKKLKREI